MTGFKNFVMRGNLVELAVAVVIGTQFSSLVKQFVSSFINPLLSLVGGTPDFGKLVGVGCGEVASPWAEIPAITGILTRDDGSARARGHRR